MCLTLSLPSIWFRPVLVSSEDQAGPLRSLAASPASIPVVPASQPKLSPHVSDPRGQRVF